VRALIAEADVLVEQFRPKVMDRLGFGYEAVRAINPRIIYCSISGYGQAGPRSGEAGHDLNYIGNTGLLALQPGAGAPTVPPGLIADIAGGSFPAVINILLALRQRDLTGEGCHLDIAMVDAMFTFAWHALAVGFGTGRFPRSGEDMLCGGSPRYQLYRMGDGALVACAALEQKFWLAFCDAIDLAPALRDDLANPKATCDAVAAAIALKDAAEWREIFARADCCCTIVASLEEALQDPHFVKRGLFAHSISGKAGSIPALPVPIAPQFRKDPSSQ
jgi:crotonobetainyl-CoA:carnitine CoA-transferase CaiB-like acyl-CoA transferase